LPQEKQSKISDKLMCFRELMTTTTTMMMMMMISNNNKTYNTNSAHVECESERDTSNMGQLEPVQIIQTIPEQHTGKA